MCVCVCVCLLWSEGVFGKMIVAVVNVIVLVFRKEWSEGVFIKS